MAINPLFFLATCAVGWGFSLAIYRAVAYRNGWPMGYMQARYPLIVTLLGVAALVLSFLFIAAAPAQRWPILLLGLLFALFWLGFLRVAAQTALFLAPLAALLLGVLWASNEDGLAEIRNLEDRALERANRIEQRLEERWRQRFQPLDPAGGLEPAPVGPARKTVPQ